jgi:hypothetical protein
MSAPAEGAIHRGAFFMPRISAKNARRADGFVKH